MRFPWGYKRHPRAPGGPSRTLEGHWWPLVQHKGRVCIGSRIVVEKPGADAGSGAGPTPGLRGKPVSGPQGPGLKASLYAVGPCESAPPIGRTLHRPESDTGPLRVDMPL